MATTITISKDTKEVLENLKGKRSWDVFLKELAREYMKSKREKIRKELRKLFVEETRVKGWAREYW